jgi:hypothetical protein
MTKLVALVSEPQKISRRSALLGLGAIAAPAITRTPGLLMPVRRRLSPALIAREKARLAFERGEVEYFELTKESAAMVARFCAARFYRFPPLEMRKITAAEAPAIARDGRLIRRYSLPEGEA